MKIKIYRVIIIVFITIASLSCKNNIIEERIRYFPEGIFSEKEDLDDFVNSWYSKHLIALEEPSLYKLSNNKDVVCYRFLCLRTFDNPFSIRIELNSDNTGLLYYKRTDGAGGYNPGHLIDDKTIILSKKDIIELNKYIRDNIYWELPNRENNSGLDGSQWIIEGIKKGNYKVVDRWTPNRGAIRILGEYFIKLSKEEIEDLY